MTTARRRRQCLDRGQTSNVADGCGWTSQARSSEIYEGVDEIQRWCWRVRFADAPARRVDEIAQKLAGGC